MRTLLCRSNIQTPRADNFFGLFVQWTTKQPGIDIRPHAAAMSMRVSKGRLYSSFVPLSALKESRWWPHIQRRSPIVSPYGTRLRGPQNGHLHPASANAPPAKRGKKRQPKKRPTNLSPDRTITPFGWHCPCHWWADPDIFFLFMPRAIVPAAFFPTDPEDV